MMQSSAAYFRCLTLAGCKRAWCCAWLVLALHGIGAAQTVPNEQASTVPIGGMAVVAALEQAVIDVIGKAEQSVVAIVRTRRDQAPNNRAEQFQLPGVAPIFDSPMSPDHVPTDFASGVVISADGYIVTCAHALEDPRRNDYFVWLDKRAYTAQVVARPARVLASDPFTDLAVLKIDAQNLPPAVLGDGSKLRKGQFVIALGNPYAIARDGQASASWGIVSNLKRFAPIDERATGTGILTRDSQHQFGTLIQTDARLNFGTSGGALVNLRGELVGLTTSLAALSGYEQPAGFAIAVDELFKRVTDALRAGKLPEFGFLGIQPNDLREADRARGLSGVRITSVVPGMPGDQAGLRSDDVISQVNGRPIDDRNSLFRELSQLPAGTEISILLQRMHPLGFATENVTVKATLSKKYVATQLPAYAVNTLPKWNGMFVEYITAVPTELSRGAISNRRLNPKLAILSVDPDSPAWKAGLRAGNGLMAVNNREISSPLEFLNAVEKMDGLITLQVVRDGERAETISIPAPTVSIKQK